ncbi:MAG: N-acetylmuramoyl-L-alanine amidase [Eubacteriales bacterium]|nr:N-acetylmuramoyl-L-alanine amidase [Eubacteriales bacterium]
MCRRKNRKRKRTGGLVCALAVLAATGVFSLYMAAIALAAPQNPAAEAAARKTEPEETAEIVETAEEDAKNGTVPDAGEENAAIPDAEEENIAIPDAEESAGRNPEEPLVVVDAGHGGIDEGCSSGGVLEKDVNLQIALLVREELENMGFRVVMTRDSDTYLPKEARAEMANLYMADAYISIHQNSYEDVSAKGVETWYDETDGERDNKRLAQLVHRYVLKNTQAQERELKGDAQLCVTGQTIMPACLIETGFLSNDAERGLLTSEEYQKQIARGIAEGIELFFRPKTMYLTFDDGPSTEQTNAVLDILKARNIKATFFVVGENVRKNPETARRIAQEGHTIGIHCNSHDYEEIYASADSYLQDFEEARQTVLEVTGVDAKLFRFPGGSVNAYNEKVRKQIVEEMTKNGYIYFDWNASLEDAVKKSTPEELIANAVESTLGRKKVVMLAHDVAPNTALCLEELLEQFPEYEMKPLTEYIDPIQFHMP